MTDLGTKPVAGGLQLDSFTAPCFPLPDVCWRKF